MSIETSSFVQNLLQFLSTPTGIGVSATVFAVALVLLLLVNVVVWIRCLQQECSHPVVCHTHQRYELRTLPLVLPTSKSKPHFSSTLFWSNWFKALTKRRTKKYGKAHRFALTNLGQPSLLHLANSATPTRKNLNLSAEEACGLVPPPPPLPPSMPLPPTPSKRIQANGRLHLKNANWERIDSSSIVGTIWEPVQYADQIANIPNLCILEELFTNAHNNGLHRSSSTSVSSDSTPRVISSLKARNLSIVLACLKLTTEEIKESVLSANTEVLSGQILLSLESLAPTEEECSELKKFYDDPTVLGKADRFSCAMTTITFYKQRLGAMIFKSDFKDMVNELHQDIDITSTAIAELRTNQKLKQILELTLTVGNYMNAGNWRLQNTRGFRIDYLLKLKEVKSTDKTSTLLHAIIKLARNTFTDTCISTLPSELAVVKMAKRSRTSEQVKHELQKMNQSLSELKQTILDLEMVENPAVNDHFLTVMGPFASEAESCIQEITTLHKSTSDNFNLLVEFFGEDAEVTSTDHFFGIFADFVNDFEQAMKEILLEEERKANKNGTGQRRPEKHPKKPRGFLAIFSPCSKEKKQRGILLSV